MSAFDRLATITASTRRGGGVGADGLEEDYAVEIAALKCLPLDPVDPEIAQGIENLSFREILTTAVEGGLDIAEGDILVVDSIEYPVRAVEEWTWPPLGADYLILYLEDRI